MSQAALKRIPNLLNDDLFLSFDADEIPKTEVAINSESIIIDFVAWPSITRCAMQLKNL